MTVEVLSDTPVNPWGVDVVDFYHTDEGLPLAREVMSQVVPTDLDTQKFVRDFLHRMLKVTYFRDQSGFPYVLENTSDPENNRINHELDKKLSGQLLANRRKLKGVSMTSITAASTSYVSRSENGIHWMSDTVLERYLQQVGPVVEGEDLSGVGSFFNTLRHTSNIMMFDKRKAGAAAEIVRIVDANLAADTAMA